MNIAVNFSEFDQEPSGKVNLIGRVKYVHKLSTFLFSFFFLVLPLIVGFRSHPDVGERHYPELFKQIFPNGYSGKGSAY